MRISQDLFANLRSTRRLLCTIAALGFVSACQGPAGVAGPTGQTGPVGNLGNLGPSGPAGPVGDAGAAGCPGLAPGQTRGLHAQLSVTPPPNGMFYAIGDAPKVTLRLEDSCGLTFGSTDLGSAALYLAGPHEGLSTRTACGLLNCKTDRAEPDHHRVNLIAPNYADPMKAGLSVNPDGSISYQLQPVSSEAAGTYSLMLLAESYDHLDQIDETVEMQIGTPTRQELAPGPVATAKCLGCHKSPMNGKVYMHHIHPGFNPEGSYAIDERPIESCLSCHNMDGYSPNPLVRKVHGLHRGENQLNPGVAHLDYGAPADTSLLNYTNVAFPDFPDHEKDCQMCHADDRWKTRPSRLACGGCHDNVFFDAGVLTPARAFTKTCAIDNDCASLGSFVTCNTGTLKCERAVHPTQTDDKQCATCHPADTGIAPASPIAVKHAVLQRDNDPGLKIVTPILSGGTGPGGTFVFGDTPTLSFGVTDNTGATIADVLTNALYGASVIASGPTNAPQQLYPSSTNLKTAGMTYSAGTGLYSYTFPSPLPANALKPLNSALAVWNRPNPPGTYSMWLYVTKTQVGTTVRNTGDVILNFQIGNTDQVIPRQVILDAACNKCHGNVQAHGGSRANANGCYNCHTGGAEDRAVGSKGIACGIDTDCPGNVGLWEICQNTKCTMTADPTPNTYIDFRRLVHNIHYGRLRGGYTESFYLAPLVGKSSAVIGYNNGVSDFSEILLPQDIRSCKTCHADTQASCSTVAPCGYGQSCEGGKCVNTAWLTPSAAVCLSCHDTDAAYGHAAQQTWAGPTGPVETCEVCHGLDGQFSVEKAHNIADPYVPPYSRDKE